MPSGLRLDGTDEGFDGGRDGGGEAGAQRAVGALHGVHHEVVRQHTQNPGQFYSLAEAQAVRAGRRRMSELSGVEFKAVHTARGAGVRVGGVHDQGEARAFPQADQSGRVPVAGGEHGAG